MLSYDTGMLVVCVRAYVCVHGTRILSIQRERSQSIIREGLTGEAMTPHSEIVVPPRPRQSNGPGIVVAPGSMVRAGDYCSLEGDLRCRWLLYVMPGMAHYG